MRHHLFRLPRYFTIMRHAESVWNVAGKVQGRLDDPSITLSPLGWQAAQALQLPKPHVLITSPLLRCKQTASAWLGADFDKLPVDTKMKSDILEIHAGHYEGRFIKDLQHDPLWQVWMKDPTRFPGFPGGETLAEFQHRILHGIGEICADYGDKQLSDGTPVNVCVLTHGVAMRVIKCFLAWQGAEHLWSHQATNLEQIHLSGAQIQQFQAHYAQCSMMDAKVSPNFFWK